MLSAIPAPLEDSAFERRCGISKETAGTLLEAVSKKPGLNGKYFTAASRVRMIYSIVSFTPPGAIHLLRHWSTPVNMTRGGMWTKSGHSSSSTRKLTRLKNSKGAETARLPEKREPLPVGRLTFLPCRHGMGKL